MKSVLISIQPKWCELIASGEKTVEVRKTRPKLETPFKVYIYCTKQGKQFFHGGIGEKECLFKNPDTEKIKFDYSFELMCCKNEYTKDNFLSGKVIGEFVCDKIEEYQAEFCDFEYEDCTSKDCALNSIKRVIGYDYDLPKFVFETSNEEETPDSCELVKNSGVTFNEIRKYIGETFYDKSFYAWHISDLVIYDKPKELSEFWTIKCTNKKGTCGECKTKPNCIKPITRPPQSWCYVESEGEG